MPPKIARLGHIAFETPDLESSTEFFTDVIGFEEVERTDDSVYLRAVDEFYHHSFVLQAGDEAGVDHVAWQTWTGEDLEALADELASEGYDLTHVEAGEEAGQGEAYRFSTPSGHRFEIYHEMEKPQPPEEKRSKLNNRPYNPNTTVHIAPQQIDHVQLWNPDGKALADWFQDELNFMEQEHFDLGDGTRWGTFLTASRSKIDAAIIHGEDDDGPRFHHVAYDVESTEKLWDAADSVREAGYEIDTGPGQHAFSRRRFLYVKDPASGIRIEFSTGGYSVYDPTWDPIDWTESEIGNAESHQWIGQLDMATKLEYTD